MPRGATRPPTPEASARLATSPASDDALVGLAVGLDCAGASTTAAPSAAITSSPPHPDLLVVFLLAWMSAAGATVWSEGSLRRRAHPMMRFRMTYTDDPADELIEAEQVTVEGPSGLVALRKTVSVAASHGRS